MKDEPNVKVIMREEQNEEQSTLPKKGKKTNRRNIRKELIVVKEELNKMKEQYIRLLAEFDNFKKRRERDFLILIDNANVSFIESLLPLIDDFERSLNIDQNNSSKSFREGVNLIYGKLLSVLQKEGIEKIAAIGQAFDPQFHDAIMQVESKDHPSNIVIDEALKGYKFRNKVIRHSKVVVSK